MTKEIEIHFQSVVESIFPRNAAFHTKSEGGEIFIYIDWKLMDDPNRLSKRSKKVKICISQSAVEDYECGSIKNKERADKRLRYIVEENLRTFNPNHDNPAQYHVPIVEYVVTTEMLNT